MAASEYMKLNNDNTITLELDKYNGNGFIDANKIQDIVKVKILTRTEKKGMEPGSPDIRIQYASGGTGLISRKELVDNFTYLSGKKIAIPFMRTGIEYTLTRRCNQPYGVMLLASNLRGQLRGRNIQPGTYVVAPKNQDGSIDMSKVTAVSRKMFKKMFTMPMQDIIKHNIDKTGYISNRIKSRKRSKEAAIKQEVFNNGGNIKTLDFGLNPNNINIPSVNDSKKSPISINKTEVTNKQTPQNVKPAKYNFRAIGRIVDDDGSIKGFIIEDIKGNRKNISYGNVMQMCSQHKIANLMLTKNDMGKMYLRGNGCRIEDLPKFLP